MLNNHPFKVRKKVNGEWKILKTENVKVPLGYINGVPITEHSVYIEKNKKGEEDNEI